MLDYMYKISLLIHDLRYFMMIMQTNSTYDVSPIGALMRSHRGITIMIMTMYMYVQVELDV